MSKNGFKLINGMEIRPADLKSSRAKAIYKIALSHPYVYDLKCTRSSKGDDVVSMLLDLEIPDHPTHPIREKEPVAIRCSKDDSQMPQVYALRSDFPLGLPHTNAVPFDHPVSLCVSDVPYQDLRTSFSAFDFIELIRRWFCKNAVGELHEEDRPLEIFFESSEFSYFPIFPDTSKAFRFVKYEKRSERTSVIEETDEQQSNYCMVSIPTNVNVSGYIRRLPQKLGDLKDLKDYYGHPFIEALLVMISHKSLRKCTKPLMVCIIIPLSRQAGGTMEDINMFAIMIEKATCDIRHTVGVLGLENADTFLNSLDIKMSFLLSQVSTNWLQNSNAEERSFQELTLLGTGALGSQLLDHFVRKGITKKINIVDHDALAPHNIARHTLDTGHLMKLKVDALKNKYKGIKDLKLEPIAEDFLQAKTHTLDRILSTASLVVDASTSVGVERHLALDMNNYPVRRATTFLNPSGKDVVLMLEDVQRTHRLDLLEMDYYRNIIIQPYLSEHFKVASSIRTNLFSCRSESVKMDFDDITTLSSVVAGQLQRLSQRTDAALGLWQFNSEKGELSPVNMAITDWSDYHDGRCTAFVSSAVLQEMIDLRNKKLQQDEPVETGGTFLGTFDRDRNLVYILYMIPAPEDSIESGTSYVRGVEGLPDEIERISRLTYWQVRYLGEWHSHPHGCSNAPSSTDQKLFNTMSVDMDKSDAPFVMGILGDAGLNVKIQM